MKVFDDFDKIGYDANSIITVGTFDGIHLGHKCLLEFLKSKSTQNKGKLLRQVVVTFEPHPQIVLNKADRPKLQLLSTLDERLELFEKYGIENVIIKRFDLDFASTPPQKFILEMLYEKVGLNTLVVGHDHAFGKNREGSMQLVQDLAKSHNFIAIDSPIYHHNNVLISSTLIRNLISQSDIKLANQYLGYNYKLSGKVVLGFKRGRTIGFPTANLSVDGNKLMPSNGVYLVKFIVDNTQYFGVCNIGYKPTFESELNLTIETYIFDFNKDIYNSTATIEFLDYIRQEQKFSSIDKLIAQIKNDVQTAKKLIEEKYE